MTWYYKLGLGGVHEPWHHQTTAVDRLKAQTNLLTSCLGTENVQDHLEGPIGVEKFLGEDEDVVLELSQIEQIIYEAL